MQKHGKPETEASTPQKTVRVLDEAGNEYEATYPKRAKGLVKHGRARFADESQTAIILREPLNTHRTENQRNLFLHTSQKSFAEDELCARTFASSDEKSSCCSPHAEYSEVPLTCPPNHDMNLEDNTMNEQINHTDIPDTSDLSELTELSELSEPTNNPLTAKEVFDQIAALQKQMMDQSYNALYRMTEAINDICGDDRFESDESRENAIEEVTKVFAMREKTYQQMLEIYQQMYHDLTSPKEARYAERREFMNWIRDCIAASEPGIDLPDFAKLWNSFN